MRLHPETENIPKPMVNIGNRPILWSIMKYYSFFGHNDFILCLGYKGDTIKEYFLNYNECLDNDFIFSSDGKKIEILNNEKHNWKITFADTGLHNNIGERLKKVEKYIEDDIFLANYSDAVTDFYLPNIINYFLEKGKIGCFLSVRPPFTFHICKADDLGIVKSLDHIGGSDIRINGGFFIFNKKIFKYIKKGEDLVEKPFKRLIKQNELITYNYDGFWANMDTYKDKQRLDNLYSSGKRVWEVWEK